MPLFIFTAWLHASHHQWDREGGGGHGQDRRESAGDPGEELSDGSRGGMHFTVQEVRRLIISVVRKLPKLLSLARKNHRSEELSPTLTLRGEEQRLAVTQG